MLLPGLWALMSTPSQDRSTAGSVGIAGPSSGLRSRVVSSPHQDSPMPWPSGDHPALAQPLPTQLGKRLYEQASLPVSSEASAPHGIGGPEQAGGPADSPGGSFGNLLGHSWLRMDGGLGTAQKAPHACSRIWREEGAAPCDMRAPLPGKAAGRTKADKGFLGRMRLSQR